MQEHSDTDISPVRCVKSTYQFACSLRAFKARSTRPEHRVQGGMLRVGREINADKKKREKKMPKRGITTHFRRSIKSSWLHKFLWRTTNKQHGYIVYTVPRRTLHGPADPQTRRNGNTFQALIYPHLIVYSTIWDCHLSNLCSVSCPPRGLPSNRHALVAFTSYGLSSRY